MVVHTPSKLDVLRQTAAERRSNTQEVPPSVIAANANVNADAGDATQPLVNLADPVRRADDPLANDFDVWHGDAPPGTLQQTSASVHAESEGLENMLMSLLGFVVVMILPLVRSMIFKMLTGSLSLVEFLTSRRRLLRPICLLPPAS